MNSTVKTVLFWLLIGVSALLLWEVVKSARDGQEDQEVNATQFMGDVDKKNIREIEVYGMEVRGKRADGKQFHTNLPTNFLTPELLKSLKDQGLHPRTALEARGSPDVSICGPARLSMSLLAQDKTADSCTTSETHDPTSVDVGRCAGATTYRVDINRCAPTLTG